MTSLAGGTGTAAETEGRGGSALAEGAVEAAGGGAGMVAADATPFFARRFPCDLTGPLPPASITAVSTQNTVAAVRSTDLRRIGSTFARTLGDTATFLQAS
jgi:hypothetical protein